MKLSTKGQGISLNVIIIAAIALIVLVVLIMIFTGRINIFATGVDTKTETRCSDLTDAQIVTKTAGCPTGTRREYGNFEDVDANHLCCVSTGR